MVIYLLCLFNDAFNGFDYTVSNNKELVMMRQKRANFIWQQLFVKDKNNHGETSIRTYLRPEIRNRDLPKTYSTAHTRATLDPLLWRILRFQKNVP